MPHTPSHIVTDYEAKHLAAQKKRTAQVKALYEKAITEAAQVAALIKIQEGTIFDLSKHPRLINIIDKIVARLQKDVTTIVQNGIKDSWDLSNAKNDNIFDHRIDRAKLPAGIDAKFYNPNAKALEQFQKKSLKTVARIWKSGQFKIELEQSLSEGIANGKSANKMATEAKKFLEDSDNLFRRVRNSKGNFKLSKAAKDYRPGQGKYRSSFKNARRVTATETNMAYRKADNERYKRAPDVIGYRVNLSNNHPVRDICDSLNVVYPVSFVFASWHPHCRCFVTPELAPDEEFDKYLEAVRNGEGDKFVFKGTVTEMPTAFNDYVVANKDRINKAKNPPFWVKDNELQTKDLLK